jgi:heterodisulfide reductase subunit B
MNLEIRTTLQHPIPVLHFSELLALALGEPPDKGWFARHLIDPRPMLKEKGVI